MKIVLFLFFLTVCMSSVAQEQKEGHYPDGRLRYRGQFMNGEPVGKMTHFYPDGKVKAVMDYGDSGMVDAVLYSKDGHFTMSGRYVNKRKNGKWEYHKEKQLIYTEEYRDDMLDGVSEMFYATGRLSERKHWKAGMPDGNWQLFYDDGQLRMESVFVAGCLNGKVRSFAYTGVLTAEGMYRNDLKDGTWRYYDEFGKLKVEKRYVAGVSADSDAEVLEETKRIDEAVRKAGRIPDPANFVDEPDNYLRMMEN